MFRIVRLQNLMACDGFDRICQKMLSFSSLNEDVENFIRNKAIDLEKRNFSKTALIFDDKGDIIAYFSLAIKTLLFMPDASKNQIKKIHGFTQVMQSLFQLC